MLKTQIISTKRHLISKNEKKRHWNLHSIALLLSFAFSSTVALASENRGWEATYTGDINGKVSGTIVVPGGTSMFAIVKGASMSKDWKSKGNAALSMKVMTLPDQPPGLRQLDITLDDGTECRLKRDGAEKVDLRDTSKKTYDVSMSGTLICDGGKTITVEAFARK